MYDLSIPNDKPGQCAKCKGSGVYSWGTTTNGRPAKSGTCFSCRGTGKQSGRQITRNKTYNRYKIAAIVAGDCYPDPGELEADRWSDMHAADR